MTIVHHIESYPEKEFYEKKNVCVIICIILYNMYICTFVQYIWDSN